METSGVAAFVENFYSAIERVFEKIAKTFEGVPEGESWHRDLLEQMNQGKDHRPRVIRQENFEILGEYLGFRHLRRNLYLPDLDLARLLPLVEGVAYLWGALRIEIGDFATVLEAMADALGDEGA
ncbi:MAG: hypothetical protein ACJ79H_16160 [Myxococcales bacterium]